MKEFKIGERITIIAEVDENNGCEGCVFHKGGLCDSGCICDCEERSDGKSIIFKEVKRT